MLHPLIASPSATRHILKKFATHERAMEVVKDIAQAIMDAQQGVGPKFYILPEE